MQDHKNENMQVLIDELSKAYKSDSDSIKSRKYEVSEATSFLSSLYEKIRNTVDFKDEHLVRRYSIQRFLRIYLSSKSNPEDLSDLLIKDLLRGRYIVDSDLNDFKIFKLTQAISKYIISKEILINQRDSSDSSKIWDFMLSVASSEVEKIIYPLYIPETYVRLFSQYTLEALRNSSFDLSSEQEGIHVFLACYRSLVRSDISILRYHALTILFPDYFQNPSRESIKAVMSNINSTIKYVDGILKSKTQNILYLNLRKISAPFKVLEGVIENNFSRAEDVLSNPILLKDKIDEYINSHYKDLKSKLNVRITRTLGYLFITKMVLALIIEAPVDLLILKHINYFSLAINTFFPITMFYLIARKIRIPDKSNTEKIQRVVRLIVYQDKMFESENDEKLFRKRFNNLSHDSPAIMIMYSVLYLIIYGVIYWFLSKIGFNFTSIFLFIFSVSVLSYFAWGIRARSLDLQIVPKKDGLLQSILSIISLPILKVGQRLSVGVSRLNVFILLFDFILEAPFKVIMQFFEELIDFLKSKHDEVVQN